MALQLAAFLYYTPEERAVAERLPLDSPQRKSLLACKLAEIHANSQRTAERKEKETYVQL